MGNDLFPNEPDNPVIVKPDTPVPEAAEWSDSESPETLRRLMLAQEVRRLYSWVGLLTGLSILSIGLLTGFSIWMRTEQDTTDRRVAALDSNKASLEQIQALEARINTLQNQVAAMNQNVAALNKQVPQALPDQLTALQNEINSLRGTVQNIQTTAVTRDQLGQSIQRALIEQNQPAAPPPAP